MTRKPTVYVVDDDPAVRRSLEWLVRSQGYDAEVYASAQEFLDLYDPAQPGCLVLDVRMPGMSGLELQRRLLAQNAPLPVIIISAHGEIPMAVRALKDGALDFIPKPLSRQLLLERIGEAIEKDARARRQRARRTDVSNRLSLLTPRQRQVMGLMVRGLPSKVIAADLGISQKTVAIHRAQIMARTGVESLAELVQLVIGAGA